MRRIAAVATSLPLWARIALSAPVVLGATVAAARLWQQNRLAEGMDSLEAATRRVPVTATPHAQGMADLPAPVARYLAHVLPAGAHRLRLTRYEQVGVLRTDTASDRWMNFSATQITSPASSEFIWAARIQALPFLHLQVQDSLREGRGAGRVLLWSALPVAGAGDSPELNSGALHRFLAEAVWYPTALLPSTRLHWSALDDSRATATLRQGETVVSLEFRFNDRNEVAGIYTPGRWGSFDGTFRQLPWEGSFADYHEVQGIRVPGRGEVGWYVDGHWGCVWRGTVVHATMVFD